MKQIIVYFIDGTPLKGTPFEMNTQEVQATITRLMEAEGQGALVIERQGGDLALIPTRSILFVGIEEVPARSDTGPTCGICEPF
jgi:hypothetical protein